MAHGKVIAGQEGNSNRALHHNTKAKGIASQSKGVMERRGQGDGRDGRQGWEGKVRARVRWVGEGEGMKGGRDGRARARARWEGKVGKGGRGCEGRARVRREGEGEGMLGM